MRACAPTPLVEAGDVRAKAKIKLSGLTLPLGYTRLSVVLEQPRRSMTPLLQSLEAVVAVLPREHSRPAWLLSSAWSPSPSPPPQRVRMGDDTARSLRESYRIVRADEHAEKLEYKHRVAAGRARYSPLFDWNQAAATTQDTRQPRAQAHPLSALRSVLAPELLTALEQPTPEALWRLVNAPDAAHPVYTIRLLSDEGAARLAAELAHAHASNLTTRPTNNVSDGLRESPLPSEGRAAPVADDASATAQAEPSEAEPQQTVVRDGPPSVLLDEVGLDGVAHALAASVLAPLARLLYPEWTHGGSLDSYHAFSIHRRSHVSDQTSWFRPSSNSEGGSEGGSDGGSVGATKDTNTTTSDADARPATKRTGVHSDVWCVAPLPCGIDRGPDRACHCPLPSLSIAPKAVESCSLPTCDS